MASLPDLQRERILKRANDLFLLREGGRNPWDYVDKRDAFDMECIRVLYAHLNAPHLSYADCYLSGNVSSTSGDSDSDSDYSWAEFNAEVKAMRVCASGEGGESEIESGTESESDVY